MSQKTYIPAEKDLERRWIVFDADGVVLGRLASRAARVLRGKHKPEFTPHLDCGDGVIVINASAINLTGDKTTSKVLRHHSQYPGGLKEKSYEELLESEPETVVVQAIKGMLPKNRLGRNMLKHLRVYSGPDHPHDAQQPVEYDWENDRVPRSS